MTISAAESDRLPQRAELAQRLADVAREAILPHFRGPRLLAQNKAAGHFDPVTEADRAAEAAMRALIEAEFPEDGILGEELGVRPSRSGLTWVLDPIDGTRGFMSGTPTWGVLIALSDDTGPVLGIIDQPYTGERFFGGPGGAYLERDGRRTPLAVAAEAGLDRATLFTTFPEVGTEAEGRAFRTVAERVRLVRYGMDCYAYAMLAAGQIDLVIEAGLHAYDIQAPIAVIEAAGGIVTDWQGAPAHGGGRVIAAASPEIHAEALSLLCASLGDL